MFRSVAAGFPPLSCESRGHRIPNPSLLGLTADQLASDLASPRWPSLACYGHLVPAQVGLVGTRQVRRPQVGGADMRSGGHDCGPWPTGVARGAYPHLALGRTRLGWSVWPVPGLDLLAASGLESSMGGKEVPFRPFPRRVLVDG